MSTRYVVNYNGHLGHSRFFGLAYARAVCSAHPKGAQLALFYGLCALWALGIIVFGAGILPN